MMPSEGKLRDNARSPAVLHGHEANEAYPMSRADRAGLERPDGRPARRGHPLIREDGRQSVLPLDAAHRPAALGDHADPVELNASARENK